MFGLPDAKRNKISAERVTEQFEAQLLAASAQKLGIELGRQDGYPQVTMPPGLRGAFGPQASYVSIGHTEQKQTSNGATLDTYIRVDIYGSVDASPAENEQYYRGYVLVNPTNNAPYFGIYEQPDSIGTTTPSRADFDDFSFVLQELYDRKIERDLSQVTSGEVA